MEEHAHTWMLPSPDGPTALAVCRDCGEERVMYNSLQYYGAWEKTWHEPGSPHSLANSYGGAGRRDYD